MITACRVLLTTIPLNNHTLPAKTIFSLTIHDNINNYGYFWEVVLGLLLRVHAEILHLHLNNEESSFSFSKSTTLYIPSP